MSADRPIPNVRHFLAYNDATGVFTWLPRSTTMFRDGQKKAAHECAIWNARYAQKPAGRLNPSTGYVEIAILGQRHAAHRLAFVYMTGNWPTKIVDHINRDRADNRWTNLRDVSHAENLLNINAHRGASSRHVGVHWDCRRQRWAARITVNGASRFLGRHKTEAQAAAAYEAAKARLHRIGAAQ